MNRDLLDIKNAVCQYADRVMVGMDEFRERLDRLESLARISDSMMASPGRGNAFTAPFRRLLARGRSYLMQSQHLWNQECIKVLYQLVIDDQRERHRNQRVVIAVPYDVVSPRTGGSLRLHALARELSLVANVDIVTLVARRKGAVVRDLYPGVRVVSIPRTSSIEREIRRRRSDVGHAAPLLALSDCECPPHLHDYLQRLSHCSAQVLIMDSPYMGPWIPEDFFETLVYETPNFNPDFVQRLGGGCGTRARSCVEQLERNVITRAMRVMCVSEADKHALHSFYSIPDDKIMIIPNGVDSVNTPCVYPSESHAIRKSYGINGPVVIFVGAELDANKEAVAFINNNIAGKLPGTCFLIVGLDESQIRSYSPNTSMRDNVLMMGRVSQRIKDACFAFADIAIAPIVNGSGSSLKIPDYVAHGKYVVSTSVGVRGFRELSSFSRCEDLENICCALEEELQCLRKDPTARDSLCRKGREALVRTLDWRVCAADLVKYITSCL